MKKSQIIPKICVAAILLIAALVISAPVASVSLNKFFGGGTVEYGAAGSVEFREGRPIEGDLYYVIGCIGDESDGNSDFTLKNGSYYYLVTTNGKALGTQEKNEVVLLKTSVSSDSYESLNNIWRESEKGEAQTPFKLSGVIKKATAQDKTNVEKICSNLNLSSVTYVDMLIDCSKPVSGYVTMFLISLAFYAAFFVSLSIVIQSFNRNRNIDNIEHQRAITQAAQEVKAANSNPEGSSDAMFGDTERSFTKKEDDFVSQFFNKTEQQNTAQTAQTSQSARTSQTVQTQRPQQEQQPARQQYQSQQYGSKSTQPQFQSQSYGSQSSQPQFQSQSYGSQSSQPQFQSQGYGSQSSQPQFQSQGYGSQSSQPQFQSQGYGSQTSQPQFQSQGYGSQSSQPQFQSQGYGSQSSHPQFRSQGYGSQSSQPQFQSQRGQNDDYDGFFGS